MQQENRNDKVHQRERLQAQWEAEVLIDQLNKLMKRQPQTKMTIGEMVNIAVDMGMLSPRPARISLRSA